MSDGVGEMGLDPGESWGGVCGGPVRDPARVVTISLSVNFESCSADMEADWVSCCGLTMTLPSKLYIGVVHAANLTDPSMSCTKISSPAEALDRLTLDATEAAARDMRVIIKDSS